MSLVYKKPVLIKAGVTSGFTSGVNTATFTDWISWVPIIERIGAGTMKLGIDYSFDTTTGLWTLLVANDVFVQNEYFFVQFELSDSAAAIIEDSFSSGTLTNGYDIERVQNALSGRIGWRQTGSFSLSTINALSKSGRYFQGFHSAVTLNNINNTIEEVGADSDTLNTRLLNFQQDGIMNMLNQIFNQPQLIETGLLNRRDMNLSYLLPNEGKAVGYRIRLADAPVSMQIHNVAFRFNGVATFNLYLYNEASLSPLFTQSVTTVANDLTVVNLGSWIAKLNQANIKSSDFYLVYYQNDLGSVQAYEDYWLFKYTKMFSAEGFNADVTGGNFVRTQHLTTGLSYGMLPEISIYKDFTQQIVQNAHLFDEAIGLQVAITVLDNIMNSNRSNATQRINQDQLKELYTDLNLARPTEMLPNNPGLRTRYERELKRLRDTFYPKPKAYTINNADCSDEYQGYR